MEVVVFVGVFTFKSRTDLGFENVETWNFHVHTQIPMNIFDSQLELFFFGEGSANHRQLRTWTKNWTTRG